MQTMCPGQDTRYWNPGDVFEVECGDCGYEVEFFKDDAQRRCPKCGTRVSNPKLNLGCAQWCEHAKDCLGYDPKERMEEAGGGQDALTDRLVAALKTELGADNAVFSRAVESMEKARLVLRKEGGNPKVALSAALLLNLDPAGGEPVRALGIMKEAGLDKYALEEAAGLIADIHSKKDNDSLEFKIVVDADHLAGLESKSSSQTEEEGHEEIVGAFWTKAGKEAAEVVLS